MTSKVGQRQLPRAAALAVVMGLCALCCVCAMRLVDDPVNAFSSTHLYGNDLTSIEAQGDTYRKLWETARIQSGYSPFFMAGYPAAEYTSGVLLRLLALLFWWMPIGGVAMLLLMGSLVLFPLAGFFATLLLNRDSTESALGGLFATALILCGPPMYLAWMGMVEYVVCVGFFALTVAYVFRWIASDKKADWIGMTLAAGATVLGHKASVIVLIIFAVSVLICCRLGSKKVGAGLMAAGVAFLLNAFWIVPLLRLRKYFDPRIRYFWGEKSGLGLLGDFFKFHSDLGSTLLVWLLLTAGIAGWIAFRKENRKIANAYGLNILLLYLVTYIGPRFSQLDFLQPRRLISFALILQAPLAAIGLNLLLKKLRPITAGALVAALAAAMFFMPNAYRRFSPYKLMTGLPIRAQATVDWIKQNTSREKRVLIEETEDAGRPNSPYQGGYLNVIIPFVTDRDIVGGPAPGYDILYHRVSFVEGELLAKPVSSISDTELTDIFFRYNIGWAIAFSPDAKNRFDQSPLILERVHTLGPLAFYKVKIESTYFLVGEGTVEAKAGLITVHVTKSDNGYVVIKYHWIPGLRVEPSGRVERFDVEGDPIGFIGVADAPAEFKIRQ